MGTYGAVARLRDAFAEAGDPVAGCGDALEKGRWFEAKLKDVVAGDKAAILRK